MAADTSKIAISFLIIGFYRAGFHTVTSSLTARGMEESAMILRVRFKATPVTGYSCRRRSAAACRRPSARTGSSSRKQRDGYPELRAPDGPEGRRPQSRRGHGHRRRCRSCGQEKNHRAARSRSVRQPVRHCRPGLKSQASVRVGISSRGRDTESVALSRWFRVAAHVEIDSIFQCVDSQICP